jgi:hypothetical protein
MTIAEKASTVISHAPLLQSTASQLRALQPLPPTTSFTTFLSLAPRIKAVQERQTELSKEVSDLRTRSAQVVVRWQEVFVVGQGRCWVDWESRVRKVERDVGRRQERERLENGD